MKYLIILLILINAYLVTAQEWDTLRNDYGGGYTVFDRAELYEENEKFGELKTFSGLRALRNFRKYNENDSLIKEVKYIVHPNKNIYQLRWENGVKREESFQSNDSTLNSKHWNEKGYLSIEENLVNDKLISTEYYENEQNSIKKVVIRKIAINYDENELDIINTDSLIGERWICKSYFHSGWLPNGDIIELHMNGQIKSVKKYFPKCYKDKHGMLIFLRDGIWKYYDEKGILISTKTYNNGKEIK